MTDDDPFQWHERFFACPYFRKQTVVTSPMDTILMGRALCEHCEREFLIENDIPKPVPH